MRRQLLSVAWIGALIASTWAQGPSSDEQRFRFANAPTWHDLGNDPGGLKPRGDAGLPLDVDNDGDLDLVRVRANRLEIGRNDDGTLSPYWLFDPTISGATGYSHLVIDAGVGDFDGDALMDIAVAGTGQSHPYPAVTQILLNDGAGGFQPQPTSLLPWQVLEHPYVEVADVDADGLADRAFYVLLSTTSQSLHVSIGGAATTYPLPFPVFELRFGDLNGDARPDAVLLLQNVQTHDAFLQVRINDGAGGFANPSPLIGLLPEAFGLELDDYDQDGDIDVLTTESEVDPLRPNYTDLLVFPGDGSGALGPPVRSRIARASWPLFAARAGFLDGDGTLDLALCAAYSKYGGETGIVAVARGTGGGGFERTSATSVLALDLVIDDVTAGGQPRLLTSGGGIVPVDGDGRVGAAEVHRSFGQETLVTFDLADFDGDGLTDVLAHDSQTRDVHVARSDGEGGFSAPLVLAVGDPSPFVFLDAVELDGDGRPDVSMITSDALGAERMQAVLNVGGTGGSAPVTSQVPFCVSVAFDIPWGRAYGDLDGDGVVEVLVSEKNDSRGVYGSGNGNGSFTMQCFQFPDHARELELCDATGDGALDLVHAGRGSGGLWVMPGNGDGTFQPGKHGVFAPRLGERIGIGDVDADGDLDVVTSEELTGLIVLHNDGSGDPARAALAQRLDRNWSYSELNLADLDEDGLIDLVARQRHFETALDLFANEGGTFAPTSPALAVAAHGMMTQVTEVHVADLDGDRLADICIGGVFPDHVPNPAVYFNRTQLSAEGLLRPGASVEFELREPRAAGRPYLLLGSRFGTQPGFRTASDLLPLDFDPFLWLGFRGDPSIFTGFSGRLDARGRARARLSIPPGLVLTGAIPLDFAFLAFHGTRPVVLASNELGLTLR